MMCKGPWEPLPQVPLCGASHLDTLTALGVDVEPGCGEERKWLTPQRRLAHVMHKKVV